MVRNTWTCLAAIALLAVPASAYADDPTGVLLQEQRAAESPAQHQNGQTPAFSDVDQRCLHTIRVISKSTRVSRCILMR